MADIQRTLKPGERITVRVKSPTGKYTSLPLVEVAAGDRAIISPAGTTPAPTPTPTPAPTPGGILFEGDPAKGLSQFCYLHTAVPITVADVGGRKAFRVEIQDGKTVYGSERSELANGPGACSKYRIKAGEETWSLIPIYLDPAFPNMTSWGVLTQWKVPHEGTPPSHIAIDSGGIAIRGIGSESPRKRLAIGSPVRGQWTDYLVHHKWSTSATTGFVEVFVNGTQKLAKTNLRTMEQDNDEMYISVGLYRDVNNSGTAVVNVGRVRIGTSRAAVEV